MRARKLDVLALRQRQRRDLGPGKAALGNNNAEDRDVNEHDLQKSRRRPKKKYHYQHSELPLSELSGKQASRDVKGEEDGEEQRNKEQSLKDELLKACIHDASNADDLEGDEDVNAALRALTKEPELADAGATCDNYDNTIVGSKANENISKGATDALLSSMNQLLTGLDRWQIQRQEDLSALERDLQAQDQKLNPPIEQAPVELFAHKAAHVDEDLHRSRLRELLRWNTSAEQNAAAVRVTKGVTSKSRNFASLRRGIDALGRDSYQNEDALRHAEEISRRGEEELQGVLDLQAKLDAYTNDLDALLKSPGSSS